MERGPSQVWELRIGAGRVSSSKQRQQPKSPRVGACMARTACYSVPPTTTTTTLLPTFIVGGRQCPPTHTLKAPRILVGRPSKRAPRHLRHFYM